MNDETFIERQITLMGDILKIHDTVKNVHVSLGELYPITVINDGYYFVFDISKTSGKYVFKSKVKTSISVSNDILMAFNLDFYDMKPSVVISKNILENQENYLSIFREFIHCFLLKNGAIEIRNELSIQKQEMAKRNYNWEINFPFPYNSEYFISKTMDLFDKFINNNYDHIEIYRNSMKTYLLKMDYEYMIWQIWKGGFIRYVENLIKRKLGLQLNTNILKLPFDREHFYEIGNKYIEMLIKKEELDDDIVKVFYKMFIFE